jgi:hypothetical protein
MLVCNPVTLRREHQIIAFEMRVLSLEKEICRRIERLQSVVKVKVSFPVLN